MRNLQAIFILFSFILLSALSFAQDKTVTHPLYESNNQFLRIDKIEISKDKTVLHCAIRSYYPEKSRVALSSECYLVGKSGKEYELTGSEGITLDKDFYSYMPTNFTLTFKPLDDGEDIFHFFEKRDKKSGFIMANIRTYKPEGVNPFETVIKGTVVGIPECDYIVIYSRVMNYAQDEYIPVRDGKFEFVKEYNFPECYYIATKEPNPLKSKGTLSTFYIEPGVIEITMVAGELGGNIIKGGDINNFPDYSLDLIKRTEEEETIYAKYQELSYDAEAEAERKRQIEENIFILEGPYLPWSLSKKLMSENTRSKLKSMRESYDASESDMKKDSILIEMMKMEQSPGFYADGVKEVITEMKKVEARRQEESYRYLAENADAVKNLYYLSTRLFSIARHGPQFSPFRASEFDNDPFHPVLEAEFQNLKSVVESEYSDRYFYHPYMKFIREHIQEYEERTANVKQFFEACSKIDLTLNDDTYDGGNATPPEYLQFKEEIGIALKKKDIESIKVIEKFSDKYAKEYPRHPLTNEIKKMISIASDDNNPNKWKITYWEVRRVTGLLEALDFLKANDEQEKKEREDEKIKKKVDAKLMNPKKDL